MTHPKAHAAISSPSELTKETRAIIADGMALGAVIEAGRLAPIFTKQVEQAVIHGSNPLDMAKPFGTMFGLAVSMLEAQAYSPTASKVILRNALREAQADLDRLFAHVNTDLRPLDEIVATLASAGIAADFDEYGRVMTERVFDTAVEIDASGRAVVFGQSRACLNALVGRLAPVSAVALRLFQGGLGADVRKSNDGNDIRITGEGTLFTLRIKGDKAWNPMPQSAPFPQVVVDALAAEGITLEVAK